MSQEQPKAVDEVARLGEVYEGYRREGAKWRLTNPGNRAILAERQTATRRALTECGLLPLAGRRVLEVGSGIGGELAWLLELGARPADLVGVDLLADRVAEARLEHPDLRFEVADGQRLDFPRASFDLVLALTLFSSTLEPSRRSAVATEMSRVLRPGGAILWYDVRVGNPRNPNLLAMPRAELKRLFPTLEVKARSITVAPPLARRLGPLTGPLYPVLAAIPALRSHLLATIQERG